MTAVLPARAPETTDAPSPAAQAPVAAAPGLLRAALGFAGRWSLRALVATAVVALLGLAIGPHVFGYRTMTMLTGSMAPGIEPGDVVVSTPLDVQDVEVGMVISYHIPIDDHRVVTHRVIDVQHTADGRVAVQTQGDANDAPDPWTAILTGDTAYEMRAVVPMVGDLIAQLRDPVVNKALVYGAPALLAAWMLLAIWRPVRDEDEAEDVDVDGDVDELADDEQPADEDARA
ncbi:MULTISPECIES: signal peptidase I [unclassified Blastococcus]